MIKLIAVIRPTTTETLHAEGESYEEAKAKVAEMVPEGWELTSVKSDRS
ncbi:hypothetical protein [Pseudoclavibacter sp. AY1H1]|nr:hypothetical protein [Pseudoclavibacter sp. AY1H1]